MTARELRAALQGDAGEVVTRREGNAVLYGDQMFRRDDSTRPVWRLRS